MSELWELFDIVNITLIASRRPINVAEKRLQLISIRFGMAFLREEEEYDYFFMQQDQISNALFISMIW